MYFHSQNLKKEDGEKGLIHWRCWLGQNPQLKFSISIPSSFWHIYLELNDYGEDAISFSIACPLFAIWLSLEYRWLYRQLEKVTRRKNQKYTNGRKIGVSYHSGTFWFSLWEDPMEWSSSDPKWSQFNFNPQDFLFGKPKYSEEVVSEGETIVDMPEGSYKATYKKFVSSWKRPRFPFATRITRIEIDVPVGIPHEGKGENSWDIGMDATFSSTFPIAPSTTTHQAIEKFAMRCLEERQKYGSLSSNDYLKWKQEGEAKVHAPTV